MDPIRALIIAIFSIFIFVATSLQAKPAYSQCLTVEDDIKTVEAGAEQYGFEYKMWLYKRDDGLILSITASDQVSNAVDVSFFGPDGCAMPIPAARGATWIRLPVDAKLLDILATKANLVSSNTDKNLILKSAFIPASADKKECLTIEQDIKDLELAVNREGLKAKFWLWSDEGYYISFVIIDRNISEVWLTFYNGDGCHMPSPASGKHRDKVGTTDKIREYISRSKLMWSNTERVFLSSIRRVSHG